LRRPDGAHRDRKRRGRGPGSGLGKTAGRGHKGHKARTGGGTHPWFEGGQMPLQRRIPKRGFKNRNRVTYQIVNLRDLARVEEQVIDADVLARYRLADALAAPIKLLGVGEIDRKLTVRVHAASAAAKAKVEAAGGTVEIQEA